MPKFRITDQETGRTLVITADVPPTDQELESIFAGATEQEPAPGEDMLDFLRRQDRENAILMPQDPAQLAGALGTMGGGPIVGGLAGAGTEAALQGLGVGGKKFEPSTIALRGAEPLIGKALDVGAQGVGRGLKAVGNKLTQSSFKHTDDQSRDIANAFGVPKHLAEQTLGRVANERGLGGKSDRALSRISRDIEHSAARQEDVLRTAGNQGRNVSPRRVAAGAVRSVRTGALGEQARGQRDVSRVKREAERFLKDPRFSQPGPLKTVTEKGTVLRADGSLNTVTKQVPTRVEKPLSPLKATNIKSATNRASQAKFGKAESLDREIDKAFSTSLRKEVERAAPGVAPINRELSQDIALGNALIQARIKGERMSPINIPEFGGVATAAFTGNPLLLGVATLGRPSVSARFGQDAFNLGQGFQGSTPLTGTLAAQGASQATGMDENIRRLLLEQMSQ